MLTNDVVSFEKPDPDDQKFHLLHSSPVCDISAYDTSSITTTAIFNSIHIILRFIP